MTVRDQLATALREHFQMHRKNHPEEWVCGGCYADFHNCRFHEQHLADVLLALPGIAIVELPEGIANHSGCSWYAGGGDSVFHEDGGISALVCESTAGEAQLVRPGNPRILAAALLAAANAAEVVGDA